MKKLLFVAACMLATGAALAQGTLNFNNRVTSVTPQILAPIHDTDGTTLLTGSAFLAQLYAGPTDTSLAAVGAAVPFKTGILAGFASDANSVIVSTVAPGATASVQMRAWRAADGATYEAAVAAAGHFGQSSILHIALGGVPDPTTGIPGFPSNLTGLTSFSLTGGTAIPEPSTLVLGALGAAALLLRRRS